MAQQEWHGWVLYQKKSAARLSKIRATPRLRPAVKDQEYFAPNPTLLLRKGELRTLVSCKLEPNEQGISFAELFEGAHRTYNETNLNKASSDGVTNFISLL